jgi:hypothetical protein
MPGLTAQSRKESPGRGDDSPAIWPRCVCGKIAFLSLAPRDAAGPASTAAVCKHFARERGSEGAFYLSPCNVQGGNHEEIGGKADESCGHQLPILASTLTAAASNEPLDHFQVWSNENFDVWLSR